MNTPVLHLNDAENLSGCVLAYGHFTTIHPGHIRYLKHAKDLGEKLVVVLMGDENNTLTPEFQFNQKERAEALRLLEMVDVVIMLKHKELSEAVKLIKPNVMVLGNEFQSCSDEDVNDAIDILRKAGKRIAFHAGNVHYATTDLLSISERKLVEKRQLQFRRACDRQGINLERLLSSVNTWTQTKLIVLGDTIIDQYAACEALGMSAEAPVVVVKELERKNFIGGAAVVASHIRALGAKCCLLSVVGNDDSAKIARDGIKDRDIIDALVVDYSRPTTFKKRYIVENQKLFRVSRLEERSIASQIEDQIIEKLEELAPTVKGIVISDFAYGVITNRVLEAVDQISKKFGLMLFGDVQCSSQVGSILRFKNFSLLCPNEREARIALQEKDAGLEKVSNQLIKKTGCKKLLMKLGSDGFIVYNKIDKDKYISQPFPALSANPVDVTGAGDSLLAVMATGISSGQSVMDTAAIGCCMAGLAVEQMGNSPIGINSLKASIKESFINLL